MITALGCVQRGCIGVQPRKKYVYVDPRNYEDHTIVTNRLGPSETSGATHFQGAIQEPPTRPLRAAGVPTVVTQGQVSAVRKTTDAS